MAKILIVDDDAEQLEIFSNLFKKRYKGYEIIAKTDIREVKEILSNGGVDLLLSDWNMPDGEAGEDLLRYSKQNNPRTPVIIMSNSSCFKKDDNPANYHDLEKADALISKDFDERVYRTIDNILKS